MPAKLSNFLKNEKSFYKVFFEKVFDEDEIECSISLLLQNTLKPFWQTLCYKLNAIYIAIFDSYTFLDLLAEQRKIIIMKYHNKRYIKDSVKEKWDNSDLKQL